MYPVSKYHEEIKYYFRCDEHVYGTITKKEIEDIVSNLQSGFTSDIGRELRFISSKEEFISYWEEALSE